MACLTLAAPAEAEIEIKKSRFRAFARPVSSRAAALEAVAELRARFPDARHHCWAYLLGDPQGSASAGMDDDGEPTGTAGRPILNVLQHRNVGDALIVVVRWFGGIKLGAGGLIRAYGQAAQAVLEAAPLTERIPMRPLRITLPFEGEHLLRRLIAQHGGRLVSIDYGSDGIHATLALPENTRDAMDWPHAWQVREK